MRCYSNGLLIWSEVEDDGEAGVFFDRKSESQMEVPFFSLVVGLWGVTNSVEVDPFPPPLIVRATLAF
jgi:hypothetical protein